MIIFLLCLYMPGFGGCGVGGQAGAPEQQAGRDEQSKGRCGEESEKRHDGVSPVLLAQCQWASKTAEGNPQGADTGDGGGREEAQDGERQNGRLAASGDVSDAGGVRGRNGW